MIAASTLILMIVYVITKCYLKYKNSKLSPNALESVVQQASAQVFPLSAPHIAEISKQVNMLEQHVEMSSRS